MKKYLRNTRKIKLKLTSIVLLFMLLMLEFSPFAVKATAQQLQFYSPGVVSVGYDSYNGKNVWYSRATLGGEVAYCIDYTCAAPSGTMTFRDYLSDQGMAILIHGYPNCTPASIGVNNEEEAYMATQMALWEVLNRTGESHKSGLIFRVENVTPKAGMEGFYQRTVAAAKKLVAMAEANPYTFVPTLIIDNKNVSATYSGNDVYIGPYTVKVEGVNASDIKGISSSLSGAPSSAKITDATGNIKTSLSNGDSVYVKMNKDEETKTFNINFSADVNRKVGAIYQKPGQTVQDYVRIDTVPNNINTSLTIEWEKVNTYGIIELVKSDQDNEPVVGAKFRLQKEDGTVIGDLETGTDGKITFYKVPEGNYILTEISAPEGYVIKEKSKNVTVVGGQTTHVEFTNERITGKLLITKIDDANKPLENVKFNIYDSEGYLVTSVVTDSQGKATVNIDYGTYYFQEVEVPYGYEIDDTMYKFSVTEENRIFYKTVTNERYKGSLLVVKTDEDNTPIEGVKFNILDSNKNVITTITTNEKGLAGVKNLPLGTYYYQEISAPSDVVIDSNIYEFKLESNNQIVRKDIVNERINGKIKITKVDEEEKVIAGVKFNILDSNKNIVDTIVTDKDGIAISKDLPKGKYYYKEIEVPNGYILDSTEYEFNIENNNQIVSKKVINELAKGSLKIIKYDSNGKYLSDVKFNILDSNNNIVDTIITGTDGVAVSKELPLGAYYYQEIEVPDNIVLDEEIHPFILTENNQVITKKIVNDYISGRLSIVKVDEENKPLANVKFNILDSNKNVVDTIVTDNAGVAVSKDLVKGTYYYQEVSAPEGIVVDNNVYEFKIEYDNQNVVKNIINRYAKGNIVITKYDSAGRLLSGVKFEILNEAKEVVDTIITDENGVATSKKLLLGKYFYREVSAPDNVIVDTKEHEFTLSEDNQVISKTIINELKEAKLKIVKVDENNKPLEGVTFNIYDKDKNLIDTIVTDKDGIAYSKDLEKGAYYYQEISAPEGIVVDNTMYEFEIVEDGQNVIKNMINYYAKGSLKIVKYDSNKESLAGVKFEITDEIGNVVDTIITDEKGVATTKELPLGTYYYQEIEAPSNVVIDTQKHEFALTENGQIVEKTVINELKEAKLKIIKVDENNKPLEGVTFNIYDKDKNLIDTIVTDKDGIAYSKDLEKGAYYYQEISAPEGIVVDNTMYEFEIVEDGQNVIKNMINYYIKGSLKIYKLDDKNEPLQGAKFSIYDENGNVVDNIVSDENGIALSKDLPYGTYYYKEIEAPDGYVLDNTEYKLDINSNIVNEAVVYNVKEKLPETGGLLSTNMKIILSVMFISTISYSLLSLLRQEKEF